jgi:hypothetical protein
MLPLMTNHPIILPLFSVSVPHDSTTTTTTTTTTTMATSMAAAIAASLPAPQASSAPVAPIHEPIPASMSKLIDIEAEIPLNVVRLEGLVCPFSSLFHPLELNQL